MLNTIVRSMIVAALMLMAGPAYSDAVQIFFCQQDDEATDEQVDEIAAAWLKAARTMKGGENLEAYLRFPIAAQVGEHDFAVVLVAPTFAEWGAFTDAYAGSPAEEIDNKFDEMADCTEATIWESHKVK